MRIGFLISFASLSAFLFTGTGNGIAKEIPPGDLNRDGRLGMEDAGRALRIVVGLEPVDTGDLDVGDVAPNPGTGSRSGWRYGDGRITVPDVTRILRALAGLGEIGDNWSPPSIRWNGDYLPMDAGDAIEPGRAVWMDFVWEGSGSPNWRVEPADAASIWHTDLERSVLLVASTSLPQGEFTVHAGEPPFYTALLGAVRENLPHAIRLDLSTDRVEYPPLDPVKIKVRATNNLPGPYTTGAGVRLLAFDNETRRQVWEARDPTWDQKVEFAGGETREWSFTWDWRDTGGQFVQPRPYTLFALLDLSPLVISGGAEVLRIAVQ